MSQGNNLVFKGLRIVVWIIFIGLSIEAGGLIINFILSLVKPDLVQQPVPRAGFKRHCTWAASGLTSACTGLYSPSPY